MQYLLLFSLLLLLNGCATSTLSGRPSLETPAPLNSSPNKKLSRADVQSDLAQAIYALETAYSGRRFLPGSEFQTVLSELKKIEGPQTAIELCDKMDRALDKASDNHLSAKFLDKNCFAFRKKVGLVGENTGAESALPWQVQTTQRKGRRALVISITSFPPSNDPAWKGFIEKVRNKLSDVHFIIVDLRGNSGADDTIGQELANVLAGQKLRIPYSAQWRSQTPESYQTLINTFEDWSHQDAAKGKPTEHFKKSIAALKSQKEKALAGEIPAEAWTYVDKNQPTYEASKGLKKWIYILMDHACASSCESSIDVFEFNPFVKRVGEPTAGYIHFGDNGRVYLDHSGIRLQLATTFNQYFDERFIEKKGISPNIDVPSGKDAMDFAWDDYLTNSATN